MMNFIQRRKVHEIFMRFHSFDMKVKNIIDIKHTKHFMIILAVSITASIDIIFDVYYNSGTSLLNNGICFFVDGFYVICSIQYLVVILLIYTRLRSYNKALDLFSRTQKLTLDISETQALFFEILRIIQLTNQAFGIQIMILAGTVCLGGIFQVFASFEAYVIGSDEFTNLSLVLIHYTIFDTTILLMILFITSLISREVKPLWSLSHYSLNLKFFFQINKAMQKTKKLISSNRDVHKKAFIVSTNEVKFSCGLFCFN